MQGKICSVADCQKLQKRGGKVCPMHYYRIRRYGSPELPEKAERKCSVEGCEKKHRANGLCDMHRTRLRKTGEVGGAAAKNIRDGSGYVNKVNGYRYLYRPEHPNAKKRGQVAEHILVMSEIIERPLRNSESVHHKNGNPVDNRPENLELRASLYPASRSVLDILDFCRMFLTEYARLESKLKPQKAKTTIEESIWQRYGQYMQAKWNLSGMEMRAAVWCIRGKQNQEIAQLLNLGIETVNSRLDHVYKKAKVRGRAELAAKLLRDVAILPAAIF